MIIITSCTTAYWFLFLDTWIDKKDFLFLMQILLYDLYKKSTLDWRDYTLMLWMMMSFSIGDHHPPCKWSLPLSYKKKKRGDFIVQSLFFIENHQFTFAGRLATRREKAKKTLEGKEDRKLSSAIHGHVFSPVEYIDISFSLSKWLKEEKHGIKLYLQLILVAI